MQWKTRPLGYFSYTVFCCLCKRGDLWPPASAGLSQISIHAPARGATGPGCPVGKPGEFQFTPLREGRRSRRLQEKRSALYFNSRPCERGDAEPPGRAVSTAYFNSRPCERGDRRVRPKQGHEDISIHAPARGATRLSSAESPQPTISIHAPARGATICSGKQHLRGKHFNSRPCERGDGLCSRRAWLRTSNFNSRPCERGDHRGSLALAALYISIHAPARGATNPL